MVLAAQKLTVQEFEPKESTGGFASTYYFFWRNTVLPPWGDARRQRALFDFYYDPYNWAIQGAFAAIAKQIAATPYEIKGDAEHKILTRHYEEVLSGAQFDDFGGGFRGFILRLVLDFLRFDDGAFVEIIGAGNPRRDIKGRVSGIATLNALRSVPTGNPDNPVAYYARRSGTLHLLSRYRVARLVDMPDQADDETGRGLSALSRAIAIAQSMVYQIKYNLQRLDDLPPAGLLAINNVQDWEGQMALYEAARKRDGGSVWANTMVIEGLEPDKPVTINHIPFSSVPEHFNFRDYTEIMVNALALALNVDPQDIWPLTGAPMGTGTQSKILHTKAAGKMLGDIRTAITRMINFYILPPSLEFQWKYKDPEQDKDTAETESILVNTAKVMQEVVGKELAAQYLVNTSERFADVLLDEEGQLRLPDDDPKPPEVIMMPQVPEAALPDETLTAESDTPTSTQPADETQTADSETPLEETQKDIQATRLDFEGDVEDALDAAVSGSMNRQRFGIVMRAHVTKYGRQAFQDGLEAGGIDDPPTPDDLNTIASLVASQSQYVTNLGEALYGDGVTEAQLAEKPALWFNKSIMPFYQAGIASADRNGLYEWVYGDTEHCDDCLRLNGQKHRMKDWLKSGWQPQGSNLECHGFNCKCRLVKTTGRASGRF